jgi:5-methyltetrahydrofolate corrinoid/iron sulfur protein methyltransferase
MHKTKIRIIGELINNSYGRARSAWEKRDVVGYQNLVKLQADKGAEIINVNIDGTQKVSVRVHEMLDFLPKLIPALQEVTDVPLSFDNPNIEYHKVALKAFDRSKCKGKPVLNSLAASRQQLKEMIGLVKDYDLRVVVMASEKFVDDGGAQCLNPQDAYEATKRFVEILVTEANRTLDDIIVDPGLAPVGADTYGLVNIGLDAMKWIHADPATKGVHFSVGLSNFAWGTPKGIRHKLERAYLTIASRYGLDYALANVENNAEPLEVDDPLVARLEEALQEGRIQGEESQEEAGFRQAAKIMELCSEYVECVDA